MTDRTKTVAAVTSCDDHHQHITGYLADHEDAELRMARGEHQTKCQECERWSWPR